MNNNNIEAFTFVNDDDVLDEEIEKDLRRSIAGRKGVKRPMSQMAISDSDSDSVGSSSDDQPDLGIEDFSYREQDFNDLLGDYFSEWNISRRDQIHLCRAYASYLAVQDKSINKKDK